MLRTAAVLTFLAVIASGARAQGLDPSELARNEELVSVNAFTTDRSYYDYRNFLGDAFVQDVGTWQSGMRILDGGAGRAVFLREVAEGGTFARLDPKPRSVPELLAVGVKKPADWDVKLRQEKPIELPSAVKYIEGKLGEDGLPLEKRIGLGTIDRIVEVYGASHYGRLDKILEGYARLLKPGGKIFMHFDPTTELVDQDGKPLSVPSYLRRVKGLKIVSAVAHNDTICLDRPQLIVALERTTADVSVPALELRSFKAGWPPHRVYAAKLPGHAAPEDAALATLERLLEHRGARGTWTLSMRGALEAVARGGRELFVRAANELIAIEDGGKRLTFLRHALGDEPREAEARLGQFDRIIHDARDGVPAKLAASFARLLGEGGSVELLFPEGHPVEAPAPFTVDYTGTSSMILRLPPEARRGLTERLQNDVLHERAHAPVAAERER